jgi:hypothetical protein
MERTIEGTRVPVKLRGCRRKWMRYSGLLLIPLAWGHVLIQDVLVGACDRPGLRSSALGLSRLAFYDFAARVLHLPRGKRTTTGDPRPSLKTKTDEHDLLVAAGLLACDHAIGGPWRRRRAQSINK